MDVRTICLGILTRGDATGYEIKKLFEEDGYQHFVEASFGSIYPALNRLTEEVWSRSAPKPRKSAPTARSIRSRQPGRRAFLASLMKPLPEDRHRSPFVFAMLFSHLLPPCPCCGDDRCLYRSRARRSSRRSWSRRPAADGGRALRQRVSGGPFTSQC